MNDQRRPSWPGEDPDDNPRQESTGFFVPDWDDDTPPPPSGGGRGGQYGGNGAPRQPGRHSLDGGNGGGGNGGSGNGGNGYAPRPDERQRAYASPQQPGRRGAGDRYIGERHEPPPWMQQTQQQPQQQPPQQPQRRPAFPPRQQPSYQAPPGPPPPRDHETEMLPLVDPDGQYQQREPELLTHQDGELDRDADRYDDYDEDDRYDDRDADDTDDGRDGGPGRPAAAAASLQSARARKKRRWRKIRRGIYIAAAVLILGPILGFFITYQFVSVPSPEEATAKLAQPVNYYFADKSLITSDSGNGANRTVLKPNQIPDTVKHAAYAAEDATFETNAGFDLTGIARAAWSQVTGGSGGGSTITQQYIKQATGNDQHSYVRKALEVVKAYKMNNQQSKSDIITAYLNTVYFGRNAYGIQAAAKAYFNTDVQHLTKPQAAELAGMIQSPGRSEDIDYRTRRATYVMDQMKIHHWMTPQERAAAKVAVPIEDGSNEQESALQQNPYLISVKNQIKQELEANGFDDKQLRRSGAKIYTSLDPQVQQKAVDANNKIMEANKEDPHLVSGQVSVNPTNGQIVAYYPGQRRKTQYDQAANAHQPGSSFKPFTFLSLLENKPGSGLGSTFDGTSGQTIRGVKVGNADEESCGKQCTVKEGMTKSVNTVFYNMAAQVGTRKVRDAAWQAGISRTADRAGCDNVPSLTEINPKTCKPQEVGAGIALGQYPVSPKDMAQAYSSFFNGGKRVKAHFVTKVTDSSGENVLYRSQQPQKPAFDPSNPQRNSKLARNVLESMTDVAAFSGNSLAGGRVNAAKTGTAQAFAPGEEDHNSAAWMVGGTPQVVTATYVGDDRDSGQPIYGNYSNPKGDSTHYDIYGREEPSYIWKEFTDAYLEGKPELDFGPLLPMGQQAPVTPTTTAPPTTTEETTSPPETDSPDTTTEEPTPTPEPTPQEEPPPTEQKPPDNGGGDNGGGNGGGGDSGGGGDGGDDGGPLPFP